MLKVENLSKKYGSKQALENITLTFENGVTGLLGSNGAGKSTLMRILATVDTPTSGAVTYIGSNIIKHPKELRQKLGYLPQEFGVYPNMNATEFLEYMAEMKGLTMKSARQRISELLEALHLAEVRKRPLGSYSGGMKQRIGIAQALLNDPEILIVDEPTVGLDPEERISFRNLLASLASERIIILSTHIVTDVESIAPKIAVLSKGKLIFYNSPETLIQSVEGKVWNAVIPAEKLLQLGQKFTISNVVQKSDGVHIKIVSDTMPTLDSIPTQPSLEDAYLHLSKAAEVKE